MAHATAAQPITVGVDTHLDSHVAHANDQLGRRVGTRSVPTTPTGYQDLLAWARGLGAPIAWGVEGTGSYGTALGRSRAVNGRSASDNYGEPRASSGQLTTPLSAGTVGHGHQPTRLARRKPGVQIPSPPPHPDDQHKRWSSVRPGQACEAA